MGDAMRNERAMAHSGSGRGRRAHSGSGRGRRARRRVSLVAALSLGATLGTALAAQTVERTDTAAIALSEPLPLAVHGRVVEQTGAAGGTDYVRQWPGGYFETAFTGPGAIVRIGEGKANYRITLDGAHVGDLETPAPGLYRVNAPVGEGGSRHVLRVDVISESQDAATMFGGFYPLPSTRPAPMGQRARQIEMIGDSHTVGYGNRSATTECSGADVFATTDTAQSPGVELARRYGADYRIAAISGRGVVRNYGGFEADTLPQAYPYPLLGQAPRAAPPPAADPDWNPRLVAISLGTNDFSSALNPGERWTERAALHADYQAGFMRFVTDLRARFPDAYLLLWATDLADGEIMAQASRVVERLREGGERRIAFVPVTDLSFAGCHGHPDLADDRTIAAALARAIDAQPDVWRDE